MKPNQLKSLKVGDKITYLGKPIVTGEVTEVGCFGVRIQWTDGIISFISFNDPNDSRRDLISLS